LNSNLCLNSSFCELFWKWQKEFLFPPFYFTLLAQALRAAQFFFPRGPARLFSFAARLAAHVGPASTVAARTASLLLVPDLRPDPEPSRPRALHLAHPRTRAPSLPLGPRVRAALPFKARRHLRRVGFPRNPSRALRRRHRTLARRRRLRSSAPPLFSRYGAVP
jgi:hypothetical protein